MAKAVHNLALLLPQNLGAKMEQLMTRRLDRNGSIIF
jgi:hypothetical protein